MRTQFGHVKSHNKVNESQIEAVRSNGNLFADLGVANAEEELAKAELAFSIRQRIKAKGLNQTDAATLLGTDQAKISLLMNGKVAGFTFDRLVRFLNALEMDVRISITPTADQERGEDTGDDTIVDLSPGVEDTVRRASDRRSQLRLVCLPHRAIMEKSTLEGNTMTVYEIYDQAIKTRPAGERLQLAKLILNDLSPDQEPLGQDVPERTGEIRDQDHLEELLLAGLNSGPGIEVTPEYWENKRTNLPSY